MSKAHIKEHSSRHVFFPLVIFNFLLLGEVSAGGGESGVGWGCGGGRTCRKLLAVSLHPSLVKALACNVPWMGTQCFYFCLELWKGFSLIPKHCWSLSHYDWMIHFGLRLMIRQTLNSAFKLVAWDPQRKAECLWPVLVSVNPSLGDRGWQCLFQGRMDVQFSSEVYYYFRGRDYHSTYFPLSFLVSVPWLCRMGHSCKYVLFD